MLCLFVRSVVRSSVCLLNSHLCALLLPNSQIPPAPASPCRAWALYQSINTSVQCTQLEPRFGFASTEVNRVLAPLYKESKDFLIEANKAQDKNCAESGAWLTNSEWLLKNTKWKKTPPNWLRCCSVLHSKTTNRKDTL